MQKLLYFMMIGLFVATSHSAEANTQLSERQLQRFQRVRAILQPMDAKDFPEALAELTVMAPVEGNLLLQEVVARTFQELVKEYRLRTSAARKNLYGRIQMNMAFLQMGGLRLNQLPPPGLDRDIVVRLKKNLPSGLTADTRLFYTLED